MSLDVTSQTGTVENPVFIKIYGDIPGGITLLTDRIPTATKIIKAGTPLYKVTAAASIGQYRIVKTAKLKVGFATANINTMIVYGNQEFKVGEYITADSGIGGKAIRITAITKAVGGPNTDYIITLAGFTGATLNSGKILLEAAGHATSGAVARYTASALLRQTVEVRSSDLTTLNNVFGGAVIRATVNEKVLPYFVCATDKTALTSRIQFI